MVNKKEIGAILILIVLSLVISQLPVQTEEPNNNLVIAAGETWGTYTPANNNYPWPRTPYKSTLSDISMFSNQGSMFHTNRMVSSGYFGNPPWSWMSGRLGIDFSNGMFAVEYNPNEDFAVLNEPVHGVDDRNYAPLKYTKDVPGADDPARSFHDPVGGGAYISDDRTHTWSSAGWPTQLGVDVKLTVHSWTLPWGHLDDFHLVELELHNTGEADVNGDGTVDLSNNEINALTFTYWPGCFHFRLNTTGSRSYYVSNNRYRGTVIDQTPDENGAPWDIYCQAIGSPPGTEKYPALTNWGEYYDAYNGYGFLGAKKLNGGTWEEKFLAFKDAGGNQIVPAIGEGTQRGWFHTSQPGWGNVGGGSEFNGHTSAMGSFYVDGGKSNDGASFDLAPNPAMFSSGTTGDPTTFVVKDPSQWTYPDGAWESTPATMATDPETGEQLGLSPMDPSIGRGRPLEPGIITEGLVSQYQFDGDPLQCMGPFSMEVGETIRVYFYRGSGFRINGLRKTVKMARAVFESIQPDGAYNVPQSPPVPEIKISLSPSVKPLVKFQDPSTLGDMDGIKIYKAASWPRFNSLEDLYPMHDKWWKTMDPDNQPEPVPYNPLFTRTDLVKDQQPDYWGPYHLVKTISKSEFASYANSDADVGDYPYAWQDEFTTPGFSYWYYVASYKEGAAVPPAYQGLDDVNWLESGKVNINGRSGLWENTWPWGWRTSSYPDETDAAGLKKLGASFVLVPPTASVADIELEKTKIGVRPNPYKRVAFHDASGRHNFMFYNLPASCTIQIYDLSGMLIQEIDFQAISEQNGTYFWDLFSKNGNEVASGLYIWVAKYKGGQQHGTFAIIR